MDTRYHQPNGGLLQQYSTSPPPSTDSQKKDPAVHQRTYQACIPCRRRKVRCDLGSVDNPHDPPCLRCRRESNECFFSSTRRKKKGEVGYDGSRDASEAPDDTEFEVKRKRQKTSQPRNQQYENEDYEDQPRTPGGSVGRLKPLRRPEAQKPVQYGEDDIQASEKTAAILQTSEVHGGHDALKLLYEASKHARTQSFTSMDGRPVMNGISPHSLPSATSPIMEKSGSGSYNTGPVGMYHSDKAKLDPTVSKPSPVAEVAVDTPEYAAAAKAWQRFKFVRNGWLTAKEGIAYIEYFYKFLSPLTPVALPDFTPLDTHVKLLTQEPMLAVTMLLVASRHMPLDGPGNLTRPYTIHQKLWHYLQGMVDRVVWGQEQFGGGFCGAGSEPGVDVNPLSRKGLRTLGTVESLMLLTEWHPRAMHFPPDETEDDLMLPDRPIATPDAPSDDDDVPRGIGGQRMDSWLEPCWRSDRMCWMLLGMAMSLAFEIGVFDKTEWQRHATSHDGQPLSAEELQAYDTRRGNVRDLLLIYVTQTSGRLGLTSMLPPNYSKPEDSELYDRHLSQHSSIHETVLHFWLRLAKIMRDGNETIFRNKGFTRDLIRNGEYKAALQLMQPPLADWYRDFQNCSLIPKHMRSIMQIEYEYCRVYLNSLALQAVAERCANEPLPQILDPPLEVARSISSAIPTKGVRTEVAIAPQTLAKWLGGDRQYMINVRDAARSLLTTVVGGLYPGSYLKHAPVRTYFRIISVAIMLLKSFSLGASESDVADSLKLMDKTVEALRGCIVDDVHVASRFADLLDTLTQNLKPRLVRIAANGRPGLSRRTSGTPYTMPNNNGMQWQAMNSQPQQQAGAGAMPNLQQWTYNNSMQTGSMGGNMNHQANPLYGVQEYDIFSNDNNQSVMPPPSFLQSPTNKLNGMPNTNAGDYGQYASTTDLDDWFALPLDPIMNFSGSGVNVNNTMYGPELNGHDMLEVLLGGNNGGNPQWPPNQ